MIFKQSILKKEKIKFIFLWICVLTPMVPIIFLNLISYDSFPFLCILLLMLFLPIYFLILIISLKNLEWFYIYSDRIEVRCLFGLKNIVYYDNVLFVEEIDIKLSSRGMTTRFYMFVDGRNNNNIINVNSCYNNKKFNLRIYKTPELEEYIVKTIGLQIKSDNLA